jgi:peroxiredoxin
MEVTYRLRKGTTIGGVVKNDDGRPVVGANVEVMNSSRSSVRDGMGEIVDGTWLHEGGEDIVTDEQGRWQLNNVPAGDDIDLKLKLSHSDYISDEQWGGLQWEQQVSLASLLNESAEIVLHQGVDVNGIVADPDGNAVAGAIVHFGDNPYQNQPGHEVRTGKDGTYRFSNVTPGLNKIMVLTDEWCPQVMDVDVASGMPPVDFVLEKGTPLTIRFVDNTGRPVPDVYVAIDRWDGFKSSLIIMGGHFLQKVVPRRSDENGIVHWPAAPSGAVHYRFGKQGFAEALASLTADGTEQTVVINPKLVITGTVTDAETGDPIETFDVPQVHYFSGDHLYVNRSDSVAGRSGRFRMEFSRTDIDHGVRIEAMGYRTQLVGPWKIGETVEPLDIRMEPAAPFEGVVVDGKGRPVAGANVCLATHTQKLGIQNHDFSYGDDMLAFDTGADGRFAFPAQYEPYALVVIHDSGYADVERQPDDQPGKLILEAWCQVEGQLLQRGAPVAGERVWLKPIRPRYFPRPRIEEMFTTTTDAEGRYEFKRVPPVASSLQARLSVWEDSLLGSSQSVPLDLQSGEHRVVDLGGDGATVTGHVRLAGDAARQIELHYSLNYLLRMVPGIEPPESVAKLGFDWRGGWSPSWSGTEEGAAYQQTLHHYFVKLDGDGAFRVSGVPAGDYELALKIYEPPTEGCLVYPVGTRSVKFQVTEADIERGSLELGDVEVAASLGPKPGDAMPDIELTQIDGTTMRLSELRGRPVLLDVWATWCGPCVASLPKVRELVENRAADSGLAVLGLSVDADKEAARAFLDKRNLPWPQVLLGDWDETPVPEQLGISSVPAYFLIDADGVLVERGFTLETVLEKLGEVGLER